MEKQTTKQQPITTKKATPVKKNNTINKLMIIIVILLLGFCGYLIWQNLTLKKLIDANKIVITNVSSERDQVKSDLEDMLAQYKEMEANNEDLSDELEAEKAKIEELIKKAKGKDWSIYKLRKETKTLRKIMKGYVVQIDSLNQLNNKLHKENLSVNKKLITEKDKNQNLTEKNNNLTNIVTVASHLKTVNLKAYAVKIKSNNTGKLTERAKKAGKLRTEFIIQKNKITKAGNKTIYVRILTPDGRVLSEKTDDNNKFNFNGVRGLFTAKKEINYQNQEMKIVIDWKKINDFSVGEYNVEVYADGVDIGKTKFLLK